MLPLGTRIADRYSLEALLGAGGMGEVYVAFDTRLERRVALKVLVPQASYSQQTLADWTVRMMREARAAASFTHPNVVGIHDVGVHDGQPFLALELVKGASLRTYIGKDVPISRKARWLVDIAQGLGAAHRAGVIHRDVKPDNVLVSDDGPAKVLDFGIARRVDNEEKVIDPSAPTEAGAVPIVTAPGTLLGTPSYMAPEQLHGEQVDGRTDQFAWGVLAFELLSGKLPWTANDTIGTIAAILTRAPQPLPDEVPPLLREVVLRSLSRDKDARFATMERVAEIVRRFAERVEGDDLDDEKFVEGPTASSGSVPTEPRAGAESVASEAEPPSTDVDPAPPKMEGTPPPFATTLQSAAPAKPSRLITPRPRLAAVALVLGVFAVGTYALTHRRATAGGTSHCAEIDERFGAPVCLVPLPAALAAKRGESYRITSEGGRIVRVETVNGRGTRMESTRDRDVAVHEFHYRPDGTIADSVATDLIGRFRRKLVYGEGGLRVDVVDLEGRPLGLRGTSIQRIDRVLDARGYVTRESFHTRGGAPRADASGAFGHLYERDDKGREIRTTQLGADNAAIIGGGGFVSERCVPAPLGGCLELFREGVAGKPAHDKGAHLVKREYDAAGNVTLDATFDVDGKPASPVGDAVFSTTFSYDAFGNTLEVRYRGKDGLPVRVGRGFAAAYRFAYDDKGRRIEERHLDPDGNLMRSAWGASIFRYAYDPTTGSLIEEAGFDASNVPTVYTFGCAKRRIEQIPQPRSWSVRCFDTAGEPSRDTAGVFWNRYEADLSGKTTTWSSVDAKGALAVNRDLEARVRWKYDAAGNEVERTVLGVDERPAPNAQGYARRTQTFDAESNLVEVAYFDGSGVPTFIRDGFSSSRMKYDPRGLRIEQTWHDTNGNGVVRPGNYAGERRAYDRHGRLVEITSLDIAGHPTKRSGGYVTVRYRRDEAGRVFETAYLDEQGKPTRASEGYAVERLGYDVRGLPLTFTYEDGEGKAVARAGGFAKHTVAYDERGNPIAKAWFGVDGRPVPGPNGSASEKLRYDAADRVVAVQLLDAGGSPVLGTEGYATLESRYDEDGNEVESTTLDVGRRPVVPKGKTYATVRRTFDSRRNNLELSTFDARGGPVADEGGAATTRSVYDALGRVVAVSTFDARGFPVNGAEGAPSVKTIYDEHGNVVERTFLDGSGKRTLGKDGFATRRARFDARGRTVEESFFDVEDKPVLSRRGAAKRRFVFDLRGNLLETVSLGLRDEPVAEVDGLSSERRTYDDRNRVIEIARFDLAGKPVASDDKCHRQVVQYDPGPGESGRACFDVAGKPVPKTK